MLYTIYEEMNILYNIKVSVIYYETSEYNNSKYWYFIVVIFIWKKCSLREKTWFLKLLLYKFNYLLLCQFFIFIYYNIFRLVSVGIKIYKISLEKLKLL